MTPVSQNDEAIMEVFQPHDNHFLLLGLIFGSEATAYMGEISLGAQSLNLMSLF